MIIMKMTKIILHVYVYIYVFLYIYIYIYCPRIDRKPLYMVRGQQAIQSFQKGIQKREILDKTSKKVYKDIQY